MTAAKAALLIANKWKCRVTGEVSKLTVDATRRQKLHSKKQFHEKCNAIK